MTSPARQRLDFALLYALYLAARPLPRRWLLALGRGLGGFVWRVLGFRRAVVLDNLRHAFAPNGTRRRCATWPRRFYRNLGMTLMEFLAMPRLAPADVAALVDIEGAEHLETMRRLGRGGLLVSGHFGNWELMGARVAAEGQPVNFIVKTQHNARVDRMQNEIRHRRGHRHHPRRRLHQGDDPAPCGGRNASACWRTRTPGPTGSSASSWDGRRRSSGARPTWPGSWTVRC